MINLIKLELKKIFRKRSFLILTIIFIMYAILTNVIYKTISFNEMTEEIDIAELKEINKSLDLNNSEDKETYIINLTNIEVYELKNKEKDNTAKFLIDNYLWDLIYAKNENLYGLKEENKEHDINLEITNVLNKINDNDWEYFTKQELQELKNKFDGADLKNKEKLEELIKLEEYRLDNKLGYDNDNYLCEAINTLKRDIVEYYNLVNKNSLTKNEEERLLDLKEVREINKYILDNKVDINNSNSLRAVLRNFPNEFGLFILIYIVMISGTIVSEEFNKGTIKFLLTKPYKRSKILTAKLLTVLLLIPLIIIIMSLLEVIVGGLILGFDTLNVHILLYNNGLDTLIVRNIFVHLVFILLGNLPIYVVLGIICFMLSTITVSSSAAITITFLFYLVSNVISNLVLMYKIKFLNLFISLHWDFTYLMTYENNPFDFSVLLSLIVIGLYISVILGVTYIYFNKKDVKNV